MRWAYSSTSAQNSSKAPAERIAAKGIIPMRIIEVPSRFACSTWRSKCSVRVRALLPAGAEVIAGGCHGRHVLLGHRDLGDLDDPEAGLLHAGEDLGDALFGDVVLEHHELDADSCHGNLLWLSRAASPGAAQRAAGHVAITVA